MKDWLGEAEVRKLCQICSFKKVGAAAPHLGKQRFGTPGLILVGEHEECAEDRNLGAAGARIRIVCMLQGDNAQKTLNLWANAFAISFIWRCADEISTKQRER
jgi:hypothetical protein